MSPRAAAQGPRPVLPLPSEVPPARACRQGPGEVRGLRARVRCRAAVTLAGLLRGLPSLPPRTGARQSHRPSPSQLLDGPRRGRLQKGASPARNRWAAVGRPEDALRPNVRPVLGMEAPAPGGRAVRHPLGLRCRFRGGSVTAEPLRQRARHLYHGKGRTAYRVAAQLELPLLTVLEIVRVKPLPTCIRPGCGRTCARDGARYCSKRCAATVLAERNRSDGCGCTDTKLCATHRARLERARETDGLAPKNVRQNRNRST